LTVVIDASIAIKWVVAEPDSDSALALLKERLSAPDLLIPECTNVLWKKVRRGELRPAEAIISARLIERSDIELHSTRPLAGPAAELAIALDHPAYDCFYLALAELLGSEFVTVDEGFYRKAAAAGKTGVRLLREW
jgi:predicted nucleic acid-binding protein